MFLLVDEGMIRTFAIIENSGRYLVVEEKGNRWKGSWFFPGGALRKGENMEKGLAREVLEETGFKVEVHGIFYFRYYRKLLGSDLYVFYRAYAERKQAGEGSFFTQWLTYEELGKMPIRQDALKVLDAHRKLFCVLPGENFRIIG